MIPGTGALQVAPNSQALPGIQAYIQTIGPRVKLVPHRSYHTLLRTRLSTFISYRSEFGNKNMAHSPICYVVYTT